MLAVRRVLWAASRRWHSYRAYTNDHAGDYVVWQRTFDGVGVLRMEVPQCRVESSDSTALTIRIVDRHEPLVRLNRENNVASIVLDHAGHSPCCSVSLPSMASLDVLGGEISLEGLLLDQCRLSGKTVTLSNVKLAKTLSVDAAQVTCRGLLQSGDIKLETQKLLAQRILVSRMMEVTAGEVMVNALYTDSLRLDCQGSVDLGTIHGHGTLSTGNIRVGSMEGNFDVITTSGKVNLLVARTEKLTVRTTTGDVYLYFLTPYSTSAQGCTVYRHADIPNCTDNDATVRVFSKDGRVYLDKQDWATHIFSRQT